MGAHTAGLMSFKQDYTSLKDLTNSIDGSMSEQLQEVNDQITQEMQQQQLGSYNDVPETVKEEEIQNEDIDNTPTKKRQKDQE